MEQVIWESEGWQIVIEKNKEYPKGFLYVRKGSEPYYPYKCLDGVIVYDSPDEVPLFVKDAVRTYMKRDYNP